MRGINDWKREQAKQSKYLHGERASITIYPSSRTPCLSLSLSFIASLLLLCQQMLSHDFFPQQKGTHKMLRVCLIPVSCIWVAIEILQIAHNECENFWIEKQWTWHRFIVLTANREKKIPHKQCGWVGCAWHSCVMSACGLPQNRILLRFNNFRTIGQGVNSFQSTKNWDRRPCGVMMIIHKLNTPHTCFVHIFFCWFVFAWWCDKWSPPKRITFIS